MKSLKIIFFGSPYYSVPLLDKTIELGHDVSLVVSQGTTKTRRGKVIKTPVHQCCEEKNIKYILPDRFSDSVTKKIMSSNYDLGIIYAYGKLVPISLIDHCKYGITPAPVASSTPCDSRRRDCSDSTACSRS